MDYNVVVLSGKVAAPPELRKFESGSKLLRILVSIRVDSPRRRVDVVPVTWWDADPNGVVAKAGVGSQIWVSGAIQRRFWSGEEGRKSRIEVVATDVQLLQPPSEGDGQ